MITWSLAFLCALMASAVMTAIVRRCATELGWLEAAGVSSRKVHQRPTPRVGGIAIVVGFFGPLVGLLFVDSGVGSAFLAESELVSGLLLGGIAIAALGLCDDLRGVRPTMKLAVQAAIATALWCAGLRVEVVATPLIGGTTLGVLGLPLTVLWIVGVINAMNLIDGLDGLAGGIAFVAVITNFFLAFSRGDVLMCLIMASLGGAILGFLVFNFNPASIFMGDCGSMFLGFVLAVSSIQTSQKGATAFCVLVPVLALGLPIMDTLLAIARRARRGRGIFSADKEHIHHRMMSKLSLSHRGAVLALYALSSLFALGALELAYGNSTRCGIVLAVTGLVVVAVMRTLGYLGLRDAPPAAQIRRRTLSMRAAVRESVTRLRAASDVSEIKEALRPTARALGAARVVLEVPSVDTLDGVLVETGASNDGAPPFEVVVDATGAGSHVGRLRVSWLDGRSQIDRDDELALEALVEAVAAATARIDLARRDKPHDLAPSRATAKLPVARLRTAGR